MRKISILPSVLTLCNFSCGILSIILCMESLFLRYNNLNAESDSYFMYGCMVVFGGMVFDMLDGRVARMTHSESQFGAELDSLADVCTFGIAPAIVLSTVWFNSMRIDNQWWSAALLAGIIYAICAVLRLAIYNLTASTKAKNYFSGLPSPAAAGAVVSTVLFYKTYCLGIWSDIYSAYISTTIFNKYGEHKTAIYIISAYTIIVALLMVSPFRFAHAANILLGKTGKYWMLLLAVLLIILLIEYPIILLFMAFNGFMIYCIYLNIKNKIKNKEENITKEMEDVFSLDGMIESDNKHEYNENFEDNIEEEK